MKPLIEDIANAAVLEAVEKYKLALIRLKRNPKDKLAKKSVRAGEQFLFSDEFGRLTTLDPNYLDRKLKAYVEKNF